MAKIEKVTVFCDGPCGGNEIDGDPVTFVLRRGSEQNRSVDLCDSCAPAVEALYDRGTPSRPGRKTGPKVLARTDGGTVEAVEPVQVDPRATAVDMSPTTSRTVPDPFAEAPLGTGV